MVGARAVRDDLRARRRFEHAPEELHGVHGREELRVLLVQPVEDPVVRLVARGVALEVPAEDVAPDLIEGVPPTPAPYFEKRFSKQCS